MLKLENNMELLDLLPLHPLTMDNYLEISDGGRAAKRAPHWD